MSVEALEDWINHWREESQWTSPPYITKDDLQTFQTRRVRYESIIGFDGLLKSGKLFHESPIIHAGLLPVPYLGNLRNAEVVICLLNPGFGPVDYFAEDHDGFLKATWANLLQRDQSQEFPFFALDPRFAWTGAFTWWRRKLQPVVVAMQETNAGMTSETALRVLGKRMAAVELVPYHSNRASFSDKVIDELKSARLAKKGVEALRDRGALVIYVRSVKRWGKDYGVNYDVENSEIRFPKGSGQHASLKGVASVIAQRLLR